MRTWCICDELPVFLGGFWFSHGVLEKRAAFFLVVYPYRDPTQVPLV